MRKYYLYVPLIGIVFRLIFPLGVYAHCPLCAAGAAAGLTLTRLVGVDDSVSGVWLGGLLSSMSYWFYFKIPSRFRFYLLKEISLVLIVFSTIWMLYSFNLINKHGQIAGMDKLTFGVVLGSAVFFLTDFVNGRLISLKGKVFFPYQRVIVSLATILLASFAVYIVINYYI